MPVYILHFDRAYHHARHYVGYVESHRTAQDRLRDHLTGKGSPLVLAVHKAGIDVRIAVVFTGSRWTERELKNRKSTPDLCPLCRPLESPWGEVVSGTSYLPLARFLSRPIARKRMVPEGITLVEGTMKIRYTTLDGKRYKDVSVKFNGTEMVF